MKCSYHPTTEATELCSACNRPLCPECAHQIKSKIYCQDCLVRGAEWAAAVKDLHIPRDSPKRAAACAIIPGIGAVYNGEYMKALTYFAVFAALAIMGDDVHPVFGFGAAVFLLFTMFDSYRTAEAKARARLESGAVPVSLAVDRSSMAWGVFLMVLGGVFLLQRLIPFHFMNRLWPLLFIALGGYLVYRALEMRQSRPGQSSGVLGERKPFEG
jgi:hypothetical protein